VTPDLTGHPRFLTTHWSIVVSAAASGSPHTRESLERLCELYWRPVYAYIRRRGLTADEAADLTQQFFTTFLEKNFVRAADPGRGRFRSFLLTAVKHFLCNEWDRARARKRGGGIVIVPLDVDKAEHEFRHEPATVVTPERLFEYRWALTVLEGALEDLRLEQERAGKAAIFACLRPYLTGGQGDEDYGQAARTLQSTPGAVRVAVHRLRRRFRAILLEHVGRTVDDPSGIDAELRYLAAALHLPERTSGESVHG
jgi:RNA polymerase sigma-70 factor (ECF subfamily)